MRRLPHALSVLELARHLGDRPVHQDDGQTVDRLASLAQASASDLSFLSAGRHAAQAAASRAGVFLTSRALSVHLPAGACWIESAEPYRDYAQLARWFDELLRPARAPGVHAAAVVSPDSTLEAGVRIDAGAVIGAGCRIGAEAQIGAGVVLGERVTIGPRTVILPRVVVADDCEVGAGCIIHSGTVIGSDGFGFARGPAGWEKIPQLGRVVIGDEVEIGANCAIDRGALEDTEIGKGCKLDNLIQVAHNVQIGPRTAIAACVGIAGSARIGADCMIGGGAGILGHLEICDGVTISAMSLVTRTIRQPGVYSGVFPLMDHPEWERAGAILRRLPDWRARWRELEARFKEDQ
jgi:UDP-3-O-[3-hydroxymyristoyl] glucosamine N-acyltransferase